MKRAIKALPKEKIMDVESFKNEIEILKKLVSPFTPGSSKRD
jgi:hypothetical protein